jgi:hypothetical protein
MTREEALALYHPIRASVRRILSAAISVYAGLQAARAVGRRDDSSAEASSPVFQNW